MKSAGDTKLSVLLAMAMFVFVVDTSFMNVSISAVVADVNTTVSGVQSAVTIEALVSAAFIMIGSKVGDLIGRKRTFIAGLVLYALGALTMTVTQSLTPIIIFWAVIGGLGASLYLPAMQSLIHGNFEGVAQAKAYAVVGAAAAIAAAIGPLLGGLLTTYLSWRVGFMLEALLIVVVLVGSRRLRDVEFTGDRGVDYVGSALSVIGMGGLVLGVLAWQEGGEYVGALMVSGVAAMIALFRWLFRRMRENRSVLFDPTLFRENLFSYGITTGILQQLALGGLLISIPIYLQMVLEYNAMESGLTLAPLSLTMFVVALIAGKRAGRRRPALLITTGFALLIVALAALIALIPRSDSGLDLALPLIVGGAGFGLLVSQLNNYTLAPIDEDRVGAAAGVNSSTGSFGLSLGLAIAGAVMLASLSLAFTSMSDSSDVLSSSQKSQVAVALEDDAQIMSNTLLDQQLDGQPQGVQDEIIRINTEARPLSLQIALVFPLIAAIFGCFCGFRMLRLPDPQGEPPPVAAA